MLDLLPFISCLGFWCLRSWWRGSVGSWLTCGLGWRHLDLHGLRWLCWLGLMLGWGRCGRKRNRFLSWLCDHLGSGMCYLGKAQADELGSSHLPLGPVDYRASEYWPSSRSISSAPPVDFFLHQDLLPQICSVMPCLLQEPHGSACLDLHPVSLKSSPGCRSPPMELHYSHPNMHWWAACCCPSYSVASNEVDDFDE